MSKYPYQLAEKILEELYPEVSKTGGAIENIDLGEVHSILAKFYEELSSVW